jgi:HEAT repeat protein
MKRELRALLLERRFGEIAERAGATKRVLGTLVSLTFDPDPVVGWRAVEAMGVAAERIAQEDPEAVREHLRKLVWLLSEESGGICWRAPEAMAEIVSRQPVLFADFIPIVVHLIQETAEEDLGHFRAGMLWAIGRLGAVGAGEARAVLPVVLAALEHADPQVRGTAVWALGRIGRADTLAERRHLIVDDGVVALYEDGEIGRHTVAEITRRVRAVW